MRKQGIKRACMTAGLMLASVASTTLLAQPQIRPELTVVPYCTQSSASRVECNYRFTDVVPLYSISATVNSQVLPSPVRTEFPGVNSSSAILFLIDTSDPGRADVVTQNIKQLEIMLTQAQPHHAFGLATFDDEMRVIAPIGSSTLNLLEASKDIQATGKTTELYRSTIEGIELLNRYPADRRAIYLFSDGLAEDRAYNNNDVVKAAREAGVVIYSLGFSRSVLQSVALQTVRRLAEESGGHFVAGDAQMNLPGSFMLAPFEMMDSGGTLSIDLSMLADTDLTGKQVLQLDWETDGGVMTTYSDIVLRSPAPVMVIATPATETQAGLPNPATGQPTPVIVAAPRVAVPATIIQSSPMATWVVYGIWGVAGVLVMILLIWGLRREMKKQKAERHEGTDSPDLPSYAFLEVLDGSGVRHPITTTAFRIGRHSDNDLKLPDNTVSRHHAEILRRRDGTFSVTDLDSVNGVVVNERSVKTAVLQEGDEIECGDICLKFTIEGSDMDAGEDTVLLDTKVPYLAVS